MEESRQWAVLKDRQVWFNIDDNPAEKGEAPFWSTHVLGAEAVKKHDAIIEREAKLFYFIVDFLNARALLIHFFGACKVPDRADFGTRRINSFLGCHKFQKIHESPIPEKCLG